MAESRFVFFELGFFLGWFVVVHAFFEFFDFFTHTADEFGDFFATEEDEDDNGDNDDFCGTDAGWHKEGTPPFWWASLCLDLGRRTKGYLLGRRRIPF